MAGGLDAFAYESLSIYVDGSCTGNRDVKRCKNNAGWGVLVTAPLGALQLFGPVVTDSNSQYFLGAEHGSNNTAELSAICEALLWLRDHETSCCPAVIHYDSKYAANVSTGKWAASKNTEMVSIAQALVDEVMQTRKLRFEHVKAHSGQLQNEHADELAKLGATGSCCRLGRYAP